MVKFVWVMVPGLVGGGGLCVSGWLEQKYVALYSGGDGGPVVKFVWVVGAWLGG